MPIYKLNGETYDIPSDVVADFEKDNPNATVTYFTNGDEYEIPVNERDGFLAEFPDATTENQASGPGSTKQPMMDAQMRQAAETPTPAAATAPSKENKKGGYQPSWQDMMGFQQTIGNAGFTTGTAGSSFDKKATNLQKRQGLNVPKRVNVGETNNLVEGEKYLNPETGKLEQTYITSQGNEYDSKAGAEAEQRQIDDYDRKMRYATGKGMDELSEKYVTPLVDEAMKKADEDWFASMKENIDSQMAEGMELHNIRMANEEVDPDRILQGLQKSLEGAYKNPEMQKEISRLAESIGMSKDEYLEQIVAPSLAARLENKFASSQIAKNMPKNATEYVLQGLGDSIGGMLINAATETKGQRAYKNQADALTEQGENPYYNPGTGAKLTRMGISFAADAPFFGVYGRVSGQVAKNIAQRQISKMMAKGLSENAARSIVGTALENSVGARMKNYLMQHVVSSSLTLGGYNATSELARQIRDKEGFDLGQIAGSTAEGLATGAAFGVTGGVAQALSQPLSGIRKIGAKVAGFGAEAETMYATEELAKLAHGEDAFTNPFEGSAEAVMKLGVMKLSGGHLLGSAGNKLMRAKEVGAKQAAAETLAGLLGTNRTGVKFTPEEQDYIRNSAEGRNLVEALSQMHPEIAVSEVNGKKKLTKEGEALRQQLADNYNAFMNNTEIPAETKQKVAQMLGGLYQPGLETGADIIHNPDGSVILKTRDKDGNCIQDLKFDSFSEAEEWREAHTAEFRLNDAVNGWNGTTEENRRAAVTEIAETLGVSWQDAKDMVYKALDAKDTSLDRDQYNMIFAAINRNAYPEDEYNPKRRYQEGKQVDAIERHKVQTDAQLKEEKLRLLGDKFAEEVIAAADYPDEKMAELASSDDITNEQVEAARDYYNATAKVRGMMDEALKSIDEQVEAENARVSKNIHTDSGSLIEASYRGGQYYITAGHFQLSPDGKLIPTDNSGLVILRDKNTGEIVTANPNDVMASAVYDPSRVIAENESMEGLRGQLMKEADDTIELHPDTPTEAMNGDIYTGKDGNLYMVMQIEDEAGNPVGVKIAIDEAGNPVGNPMPFDMEEYRKAKSDEKDAAEIPQDEALAIVNNQEQPQPQPEQSGETAGGEASAENGTGANEQPASALSRIPVDEKGKKLYEQAKPEDTLAELTGKYGEEKAREMITKIADSSTRELEKLQQTDTSGMTDMAELEAHEDKIAEAKRKADYWQQFLKEEKPAEPETPVTAEIEEPAVEPQTPVEPEKPKEPEKPAEPEKPVVPEKPAEPETPVVPEKPAEPETPQPQQLNAWQKIAQGTVKNNIGKRFELQNQDGTRSEIVINSFKGDDMVEVTRQDYDSQGQPKGDPYSQDLNMFDVGNAIGNSLKPVLSVEERLRNAFKGKVGMQNIIDVLTEEEQRRMLDAFERKDNDALNELTSEFLETHREDIILNERGKRNANVASIIDGGGSREDKLRRVRKEFQGYDDAVLALSDEALQPTTLEEYIADLHSRQPKSGEGPLAYFSYDQDGRQVVGMQDETGYGKKTGGDTKGFAPWLAPKGKGMSLQQYSEMIHGQLPESIQQQYSDQDVRNAILSVFGGAERPSDITTMVIKRGIVQAEQAARRMEEQWIDGGLSYQKVADDNSFVSRLRRVKESVNTEPTEAQKEAGNYKKGHISFGGYDFTVENPEGSMRRGKDATGREWEQKMKNTYGYILGKFGKDGDHLDMFINDAQDLDNWNGNVYVVDQVDPKTGKFDEHKILYGFDSLEEAKKAYLSNYEKGWQGLGQITGVTKEGFDLWLDSSKRKLKEFANHSIAKEHMVEREGTSFDSALKQLDEREISIDNPDLLKEYGLKNVVLSRTGDHLALTHFIAAEQGKGNGTRFMEDLARLADEKGWTLALTPDTSFGGTSVKRLKDFYKRFGFVDNKGRNSDFYTRESMIRRPKDYTGAATPERQEQIMRDAVVEHLRQAGIEVSTDWKEGQRILDEYNGREPLSKSKKRALETASLPSEEDQPTVVSSADGAKILKNLDTLAKDFENLSNQPKFFIGSLAKKLNAKHDGSKSEYATFETKNGKIVTIRLADHNATVSDFDHRNENDGISIVITAKDNDKIINDGIAHIVEFFYDAIKLRRADGKPLVDIIKSIQQSLYSGEYKDTTGLAEREEVNADEIKQHKVYHGSGAEFDEFDHSHMGEGAGSQTFGYGTYVTNSKRIGTEYANVTSRGWLYKGMDGKELRASNDEVPEGRYYSDNEIRSFVLDYMNAGSSFEQAVDKVRRDTQSAINDHEEHLSELSPSELKDLEGFRQELKLINSFRPEDFKRDDRYLYDVEIPNENEAYYIDYYGKMGEQKDLLDMVGNALTADGWKRQEIDSRIKFTKGDKQVILTPNQSGADLYAELEDALGSDKAASEFLYKTGITGIKYPAGTIMGGGDGATNYVIFNEGDAKITDRTKFFKTPDGHAYGYTYKGKVYLDPRIATSETPVHEYSHLWAEMKRKTAPEEWNQMKQVMLTDKTVQPIIDKVRRDYPELTKDGKEDDFIEEIITQFSGKRGSERLREIANEVAAERGGIFGKAEAVTAMQRLKNILNQFWEGVAKMMGWKYRNANQIADRIMADMLDGVDPVKTMRDASSAKLRSQAEVERTLMGVHNLSEEKLRKVLKQGGLANPSLAVVDTKNHMHTDYGSISLIPKASLIDARTGRNSGTFTADAWTPTYPHVERRMTDKGQDKFWKDLRTLREEDGEMANFVRMAFDTWLDKETGQERLAYWYLKDKGMKPELVRNKNPYGEDIVKRIDELTDNGNLEVSRLLEEQIKEVADMYHAYKENIGEPVTPAEERIKRLQERMNPDKPSPFLKLQQFRLDELSKYGELLHNLNEFEYAVRRSADSDGKPNVEATVNNAQKVVKDQNLQQDFDKWLQDKADSYGIEEWLYNGTDDRTGEQKWVRNTLQNASKLMKKEGLNGAVNWSSIGNWIAKVANKEKTLAGIRKNKKNLQTTEEEHEAFREKWSQVMYDIATKLGKGDSWSGENIMSDILDHKDYAGYLKREYGMELSKEDRKAIDTFINEVQTSYPTGYFETKFERPVMLDEFEIAVVPENTSPDIVEALKNAGLDVRTYDDTGTEDQKDANRTQATMDAVQGRDDIMFQMVGKEGAAEADRAEGNDERSRNLTLAEESEKAGVDPKAVKLATGWERGADGQWRYEIPDADVDILSKYKAKVDEMKADGVESPEPILKLGELLGEDNELFRYYPKMKDMPVLFSRGLPVGTAGAYDKGAIELNIKELNRFEGDDLNNENVYGTLLHEVQHAIQEKEGFALGGNLQTSTTEDGINAIIEKKERQRADIKTRLDANNKILSDPENLKMSAELEGKTEKEVEDQLTETVDQQAAEYDTLGLQIERLRHTKAPSMTDAKDLYHRLAGEVESRNVTERMGMTEEQRRQSLASETEDVPREDQVIIMGDGTAMNINDIKPVGENRFGGIYDQFKGKVKEAFDFLTKKKEGYLKGVFHRDDLGDIDLAWGSAPTDYTGKGLAHIIRKHINVLKDFNDIDEAMQIITDVVMNGASKPNSDPKLVNIEKGDYRVVVAKNEEGNWILSAFDFVKPKKEKGKTLPPSKTPGQSNVEAGAVTSNPPLSDGKDTKNIDSFQEKSEKSSDETLKFQRVGSPEPEMTPEERQYWSQWDKAMKKWKEKNAIPDGMTQAPEKPRFQPGENAMDYAKRLVEWNRQKSLWQTAPKLEDYRQVRDDKDTVEAARENEQRYPDSPSAKMRRISSEMTRIRHAMSRQKAYDKATIKAVTDFAQEFMKLGFGDNLSRGEIERMLSSVKNATGAKDIRQSVDNIMNILADNYLRNLENQVTKLSSVKELSKTAQGVEKQGRLELKGQRMIQAFRDARERRMTPEQIRERMATVAEKMNRSDEEAPMWEQEYEGLSIALQYAENIEGSRSEWADLDREYKDAVKEYKTSGRSYKAQQELLEALEQAMQENKIERIGLYGDIIGRLQGNISESMQGAREFVEREKQRQKHIWDMANFDLAGKDMGAMREKSKGKPANFFLQPLGTFEQMLKQFGSRNANGEGYLYDYFMRNWMDATDQAFLNEQKAKEELDAKARDVFDGKVKRWSDLYDIERSMPMMEVEVLDGEQPKTFKLTQGNLLYIYMADKMSDGRMKLRKMGIDEETVEKIKDFMDPRLVELGDWLQEEYLPGKRTAYNKIHERMFGAPMAAIDNYFPLKVLGDARYQEQDVNVPDSETLPSTITGNIIKRTKNALPLDILHTDALSLAVEHVEDMERWAAQAEWNKDVNTLLSYTTFRNKVKNMSTIYGSGDALWNAFKDAAKIAAGTYNPSAKAGHVDKAISNIAKGVTAAKINFRVYTAFKQILSAPAFLHDTNLGTFVKNSANPYGSWKWAMENMPVFQKRWKSRQAGDTRLMDDPTDWKMWKTNVVQLATRIGMSPNALVDGVTCAVGAKSIYETRYKQYKDIGASDEVARKRALQDAEIGYNLTQQSSEGAFVSAIQKDRTVAANMLSVFRNSSMAYTRQWVDAARNLRHRAQKGYKDDSIKFMAGQLEQRFDLEPEDAKKMAEAEYARAARHDVARLLNMMFGVTTAWNLGASLPYLLFGDDGSFADFFTEDFWRSTKGQMVLDAAVKGLVAGPTEGLAAGNLYSDFIGRTVASEQTRKTIANEGWGAGIDAALKQGGDYEINPLPLMADIQSMIKKMGYDKYAAAQDVFNICMQSAVGVNPQTFTDMWNACMDYGNPSWMPFTKDVGNDDLANSKEIALFIMRLMNAPTSSWRNKYIDELGMNSEDAKKLPYEEMARRYANYKHWKDAPIMGWLRDDESRAAKMEKIQKQFDNAVTERMERLTDEELMHNVARSESPEERRKYAKIIAQRLGVTPGASSQKPGEDKWYQEVYQEHMQYDDIREDEILATKLRDYRERDNKDDTRKEVNKRLEWIRNGKYDTPSGRKGNRKKGNDPNLLAPGKSQFDTNGDEKQNEAIMRNIRQWRKEALEILMRAEAEN